MRKLTKSEQLVLSRLLHLESMETLLNETGLQYGELRDDLTNLISLRQIEVFNEEASERVSFYDLDNLQNYYFRVSKRGLEALRGI